MRLPLRGAHDAAARSAALALLVPAQSCRRTRGGVTLGHRSSQRRLSLSARCVVLSGLNSLRVVVSAVASSLEAVAVARRSRRRCLRRVACQPGVSRVGRRVRRRLGRRRRNITGTMAPGQLGADRDAQRLTLTACSRWRGRFLSETVAVAWHSRRRCPRRRAGAPGAVSVVPPRLRRIDARPPIFAALARSHGAVHLAQQLALCACDCWRGRFPSGGGHRRTALTAPLPAAPRWRSWRRSNRVAALAAKWYLATALLRRQLAVSAWCVVLSGSRSLRVVVGAVASSLVAVAVARRSRRRCLRRRAGAPGVGSAVPSRSRRREARLPLFRGGGSLFRSGASC